jgi:hypothetical protein
MIRATRLPDSSVNQRLPSGPVVIDDGLLEGVGTANSVTVGVPDNKQRISSPSTRGRRRKRQDARRGRLSSAGDIEDGDAI